VTKRTRVSSMRNPPADPLAGHEPVWLGKTPTPAQLERMPPEWFHAAVDQLERDTVGENYWRKVRASRQAKAWDVR
jgi:hypothetical protein